MTLDPRRLLDRSARWLLNHRPSRWRSVPRSTGSRRGRPVPVCRDFGCAVTTEHRGQGVRSPPRGVPRTADRWPPGLYQYSLLDVIDIADIAERDPAEVADVYLR